MKRLLVTLWLVAGILEPTAAAERERSATISKDILAKHINHLASDELGGRGANSKGIELAAEYIAWQFMNYGLLPGGDDGSYFQSFTISRRVWGRSRGDSDLDSPKIKNVIGILPGAGPLAHEYVVIGGHYDHLGNVPPRRMPNLGDFDPSEARIHNGADDNASGTAGVMELARLFTSGSKPRRSVVFMGFTGEEIGLLGSAHFANNPTVPLDDIVAMINLDMIGRLDGRPVEIWGTGSAKEFGALVDKYAHSFPGLEVNNITEMRHDSDHASFYRKDIPVIFAFSGMHEDYHRPSDDCDKIDYDGTVGILRFIGAVADDIIQADTRPTFQKAPTRSRSGRFGVKVRMGFRPEGFGTSDQPGVGVLEVTDDQPAQKAGMKAGDRIIAIAGKPVKDMMDYMKVLQPFSPGDRIEVTVRRDDRDLTLTLTLASR